MRRKGPHLQKVTLSSIIFYRGHFGEAEIFREMRGNKLLDVTRRNIQSVLEEPMQQEASSVAFRVRSLKIDSHRVHPVNLLIGIGSSIADGNHQHKQLGMILSN